MTAAAAVLLAALLTAHCLGDFTPLATARIRQAKAEGGPLRYIALHAGIHAGLVGVAVLALAGPTPSALALAFGIELTTHFAIDTSRARLGVRLPVLADMQANPFWWALGVDQLLHGLVLVAIALLVAQGG